MSQPRPLYRKIRGCLYGGAIGDAMGAPPEGKEPEEIQARYGEIRDFVEPWDGPSDIGKGDGRHTDDTHMIRVLSEMYIDADRRLDVFDFAGGIGPRLGQAKRFVAEYGREVPLVDRLFHPEKWLFLRHGLANADPRTGGVGNMVNCGAAMYAAPVGLVNACNPERAYRDAIDIFSAHQVSFGLEAAGIMAFAVAHAFLDCTVQDLFDACLARAHEGTRLALEALRPVAFAAADWRRALPRVRAAIAPYDTAPVVFRDRGHGSDHWHPSREHSIEEVPVALALTVICHGDFEASIAAASNYGRDCDSIAGMAGSILGALHGDGAIRPAWIETVNRANRMNLDPLAAALAALTVRLHEEQQAAAAQQADRFQSLQ